MANKYYYMTFKGKNAKLFADDKTIIRHFRAKADIVNAQVQGYGKDAVVALTTKDGKTILYKSDGTIIRR
jgi:hypothetical protein